MTELLLILTIAGERVAIPAAGVESVVEIEAITPVPRVAAHVAGLSALRSRVLTVIDCAASLELACAAAVPPREAIVIQADGQPYALLVDEVEDVVTRESETRPLRSSLGGGWRRVAIGMVQVADDLLLLVDPHALLAGPVAAAA